ncbi:SDR family oxidoreductase [Agromyces seonyuensis]|uniref:NAD-dependent epimerase/dehydratase family protein n=1 Tax=Agromyces seonyuensis TaxID=2662446 RepID=A0A6I4NZ55_9MICO|nr:NAD-dependent epimerase/dehydratase family protein [Agromyces seonyuensis]
MSGQGATSPADLGDAHILITGATGFVGQAVLERILADHPGTRVSLLVRPKGSVRGSDRLRTLLRKPVFRTWREAVGDAGVEDALERRIRIVEGGLESAVELPGDLDVVIHSASAVSFDPPIDHAFATNVGGAVNLYEALVAAGGDPVVVHVSTCYVGGLSKGPAPEARLEHGVDWRRELAAARGARDGAEQRSREPERLRAFLADARRTHGKQGPQAVAQVCEEARAAWVAADLVDAGRVRAESLGWTDVYTLTKALAERAAEELWGASGHRLSVVRPAIIESALAHPYPGWIDGFKVADPLILAYGRGQLPEFPGVPDSVLDLIPVDHVVNAILAAAARPAEPGEPIYYQVASGASNPLPFHRMFENVQRFFTEHPMPAGEDGHIRVPEWRFPGGRAVERSLERKTRMVERRERLLERFPTTPRRRAALARLRSARSDLETLRDFTLLYRAYVQAEIVFEDTNTRALHASIPEELRADRGFDVTAIDWEDYLQRVHIPAITELTRAFSRRGGATGRASALALPERTDVVAVFDLEGTVVDLNLVGQYLRVRAAGFGWTAWPVALARVVGRLPAYLHAERRDRSEFIRLFLRNYAGITRRRLERIVAGGYTETVRRRTDRSALERIRSHREAGHRVVLVTGSIGLLAEPLVGLFDEVVASEMHERDGTLTGYLERPPIVGEARAAWLRAYAERNGLDLAGSYGYGDSHSDVGWLELVGHPHAVNPDAALAREAVRRRWPVDEWKRGSGAGQVARAVGSTSIREG